MHTGGKFIGDGAYGCIYNPGFKCKGDKKFTTLAKVSESEAEKIALKNYNGKIVDREYSMEDGKPVYEFDIYVDKKGYEYEVEVDAVSGKILEVEKELYDIGSDS